MQEPAQTIAPLSPIKKLIDEFVSDTLELTEEIAILYAARENFRGEDDLEVSEKTTLVAEESSEGISDLPIRLKR